MPYKPRIPLNLLSLGFGLAASCAVSAAAGIDDLSAHAFFSAGFDRTDQEASYGVDIDDSTGLSDDSIVGLQLNYQLSPRLEAVTQLVARGTDDWEVEAEWAFLSYSVTDSLTVRGGLLRTPVYMLSDYLEVGSAYPWVRPPEEVYGFLSPFSNYDGIDLIYTRPVGDWYVTVQGAYGRIDEDTSTLDVTAEDYMGLNVSAELDAWRFRLGYNRAKSTLKLTDTDLQGLDQLVLNPMGYSLGTDKTTSTFTSAGFQYDDGTWWLLGEMTRFTLDDDFVRDNEAFYLVAGHRFGKWMPYASFAKKYTTDESERSELIMTLNTQAQIAAGFGAFDTATALGTTAAVLDSARTEQTSYSLGVRYDFNANITLKLEGTHINGFGTTRGLFGGTEPLDSSANLYSFVIEAIY